MVSATHILNKSNSWPNFKAQLQSLTDKQRGDCFEALVKHYLQLEPEYATELKNVWLLKEVPSGVREKLNLPGPDEGIDLVAETTDGGFWAIQCKYLEDEAASLGRKTLSTFTDLTFTICRGFELALVCTTAERFSHRLKQYGERLGFQAGHVWRGLDKEFFTRLHRHLEGLTAPITPMSPRPHQERAIQNAMIHFVEEGNSRGKLIMPCGTGKSLIGYWIAEKLDAKLILVAVPSLALIRQTLQVWTRESLANNRDIHWMAVCSDESVSEIEREDVAVLTQDLGIRIHTAPHEIAEWLRRAENGIRVVFTTYQSGKALSEATHEAGVAFDMGILDEAHKTVGRKDNLFSHMLHDDNIFIKHRIFMTATERRYKGRSEQIASMSDPNLYGEAFELLSYKEALESKVPILSDYRIVTILVTREEIASLIEKNVFVRPDRGEWGEDVEAEMLAAAVALRKAMKSYPIKHAVSFHRSISRSRAFRDTQDALTITFPEFGELTTFHLDGKMPTAVRARKIESFADSSLGLITNARCLTEGVDVPDIDCVLFADPKKSTVDIVQAVGRALRIKEGKRYGYVVVPVLADWDAELTTFDTILAVLKAMAANDERIIDYFRTISEGNKQNNKANPLEEFIIPAGLNVDAEAFVESINLRLWSKLAKLSRRPFEEAREFARSLQLNGIKEWQKFCRREMPDKGQRPEDIPSNPHLVYKDKGWVSWGDWLGTGFIAFGNREYRPFVEAREFARSLKLKNRDEWTMFCKGEMPEKGQLPEDVPAFPYRPYTGKGWISYSDWLGYVSRGREYSSFEEAREFARSLRLRNRREWGQFCRGEISEKGKLPDDIPVDPLTTYFNEGWIGWSDWLGTGKERLSMRRQYRPFEEARAFARSLGFTSREEWTNFCKGEMPEKGQLPQDIPAFPYRAYKGKGWISYSDWLGYISTQYGHWKHLSFDEAREFVHGLKLKNRKEWQKYCKGEMPEKGEKPEDIPSDPYTKYYNEGWAGWKDWLGTDNIE
jgi:superfamily II DNA or RNA helicase